MAQLSQTFPRKKWKTSFLNEDQKVELVIQLFSDESRFHHRLHHTNYGFRLRLYPKTRAAVARAGKRAFIEEALGGRKKKK